jgi:hypothetical protein
VYFVANFKGLRGHENPVQGPAENRIRFSDQKKNTRKIHVWQGAGNSLFVLPAIAKGAVACDGAPKRQAVLAVYKQ